MASMTTKDNDDGTTLIKAGNIKVLSKGCEALLKLSSTCLSFSKHVFKLYDVLGCKQPSDNTSSSSFQLGVCYINRWNKRTFQSFELEALSNEDALDWIAKINAAVKARESEKHWHIFVNPASGRGKAVKLFKSKIQPFLNAVPNLVFTTTITTRANEAAEVVKSIEDVQQLECIVAVGGDGFLSEVVQGLMARPDWKTAIKVPLGIIPAGSGNGLACSVAALNENSKEKLDVTSATFTLVKGRPEGLDISSTRNEDQTFYSFLSFEWAFMAAVDLESDKFRMLGSMRFTAMAVAKIFGNTRWNGKLSYIPEENHQEPSSSAPDALQYDDNSSDWKTIEGEFGFFWATSAPYAATDAIICPEARVNDGLMHLVYAKDRLSKSALTSILLGLETGKHINHSRINVIRTRAYKLTTFGPKTELMAVDGENWPSHSSNTTTTTTVELHPSLGRITVRDNKLDN